MAKHGETGECRNCGKKIEYIETSIEDFWSHVDPPVITCDGSAWPSSSTTAELKEVPLVRE